jgi:hypothetical protein
MSVVAERVKEAYFSVRMAKVREQIIVPHMGPDFLRVEATGKTLPEYARLAWAPRDANPHST